LPPPIGFSSGMSGVPHLTGKECKVMNEREKREKSIQGRVASIDLRIGLNLLGERGRKLLAEYITIKRQHMADKTP
jgi:hypothetical protein